MYLALAICLTSCSNDPIATLSADVLSCESVELEGYVIEPSGEIGICYSDTNENPNPETCPHVRSKSIKSDNSFTVEVKGLMPGTKYYYRTYACKDNLYLLANDVKSFTTEKFKPIAVDLGLSVKWANCNIGAYSPENFGDYFAWGENKPKEVYASDDYRWSKGSSESFIKYFADSRNGQVVNKSVLDLEDDAAAVNWGEAWRMPKLEEIIELQDRCVWTWTTLNGVVGYNVVGQNGNSIFLPAAGGHRNSLLFGVGSFGFYWSSSISTSDSSASYRFYFDSVGFYWRDFDRYYGFSVRPVCQ